MLTCLPLKTYWISATPAAILLLTAPVWAADVPVRKFLEENCYDCHADGVREGGLDLTALEPQLSDEAIFARWERIFDRVEKGEMPPRDATQPTPGQKDQFLKALKPRLVAAHAATRGTVLRRLNRREYENTLNDVFGTRLDLGDMLPEDGRSHEFDNVGRSLGVSLVHLQRYLDATQKILETAIANRTEKPQPKTVTAGYAETPEAERFVGKTWKKLADNAVVRFSGGGYPSGMLRGTSVREPGRYRVRVRGYAYQSTEPITFSVGGTSFARGSEKPIYGFWSLPSGKPGQDATIEFETWIDRNYMIAIEPYGISDPQRYQRKSIKDYDGPGLAIVDVTLTGPLVDEWPSPGHTLIFKGLNRREIPPKNPALRNKSWYQPKFELLVEDETNEIRQALLRVANVAFRRPVGPSEIERYESLYRQQRADGNSIEHSLRTAVTAIFCSPRFLYLQEQPGLLDEYALAARLSYFLTRTHPDAMLLAAAADKRLTTDAEILSHTRRLMASSLFQRFLKDFTDNWLDLRDLDFTVPDSKLFPEYDAFLRYSMPLETRAYLKELIRSNRPITALVKSDFAMLNSRLAEHYDLPAVTGATIRQVSLPDRSLRGGFLAQASVLKVTANGTNTSPVTRGAWVMERILGSAPPPPPPGIPGVEPDIRGAATLRELLKKHRNTAACNACHQQIDPPGFALESFNPIGGVRERYRSLGAGDRVGTIVRGRRVAYRLGPNVDSSGQWPPGQAFENYSEFRDRLAEQPKQLAIAFTTKLLTFATGRELGFSDRDEIEQIVNRAAAKGYRVRDLLEFAVLSSIFRNK